MADRRPIPGAVRALCRAFPEVEEFESHGSPNYRALSAHPDERLRIDHVAGPQVSRLAQHLRGERRQRRAPGVSQARAATSMGADQRERFLRRAVLEACLPSAVRVRLGSLEIVRLRFAAAAAFFTLRRAAADCFELAMTTPRG
jgi:hypothetical protein